MKCEHTRRRDRHAATSRAHLAALHTGDSPRESAARSVRSEGDAAATRRATDARSRRSRTLRPLRGGAQQRRGCPVCVSCRWPASRGCAAVCPRHSPPCTRRLDVAVCTRQLCSKPLHGIRRSAQCAPRRPSGGIGASPGRSLLAAYACVACNFMHVRRMCVRWAQPRVGAWAAPLRFYPSAVAVVSTR